MSTLICSAEIKTHDLLLGSGPLLFKQALFKSSLILSFFHITTFKYRTLVLQEEI